MTEDISHIAKDVLQTGKLTNEHVSELAKFTAKQIYTQGWNAAIEAALDCIDDSELYVAVGRLKK